LEEAFEFIDLNKNGSLGKDELKYFLKTVPKEEIDELYRRMTTSEGGRVDVQAFVSYIQS
jgi:Ca2+-binding EF-hand superfamily protein